MQRLHVQLVLAAALLALAAPRAHAQEPGRDPTAAELRAAARPTHDETWWKHAVFYEIYPRSFQDSDGDGLGDLNGITQRLDYLHDLGVDAIWIAPVFPSAGVDFGYDVSDYEAVDPKFGTLADMDRLIAEAKRRNIRVLLDMVLNHTSFQHPWFRESASSRTNPRADWYIWNDGVPAATPGLSPQQARNQHTGPKGAVVPPNNWISLFGGSAWEWSQTRGQFYYHKFYAGQPDLNWRNPAVEQAMYAQMKFWLDRGIGGFRLDAVPAMFERADLKHEPIAQPGLNPHGDPFVSDVYTNLLSEIHPALRRMRAFLDSFPQQPVLLGEAYVPNTEELARWYGGGRNDELHLTMNTLVGFRAEGAVRGPNVALELPHFRKFLTEAETELGGGQPLLVFNNHDNARSWDRFGDGAHDLLRAEIVATMLLTSRATPLLYYGEEIGMRTHTPMRLEDVQDPLGRDAWPKVKGRDGERTPMQWSGAPQGGFSTSPHTWLPVVDDYTSINVEAEQQDPDSLLRWYKELIALRRTHPALRDGGTRFLDNRNPGIFTFLRTARKGAQPVLITMNFTDKSQALHLDLRAEQVSSSRIHALMSNDSGLRSATSLDGLTLPPFATFIAEVESTSEAHLR